jgi:hypothetical protein
MVADGAYPSVARDDVNEPSSRTRGHAYVWPRVRELEGDFVWPTHPGVPRRATLDGPSVAKTVGPRPSTTGLKRLAEAEPLLCEECQVAVDVLDVVVYRAADRQHAAAIVEAAAFKRHVRQGA